MLGGRGAKPKEQREEAPTVKQSAYFRVQQVDQQTNTDTWIEETDLTGSSIEGQSKGVQRRACLVVQEPHETMKVEEGAEQSAFARQKG